VRTLRLYLFNILTA